MGRKKKWSLKYPLLAAAVLLSVSGAAFLRWALGRTGAVDRVAGIIGAGLCWLVAAMVLCFLWSARRPAVDPSGALSWARLRERLDPYYGLAFTSGDGEGGLFDRFLRRHFDVEPPPLLAWFMPLYLFVRMIEACDEEADWSHFLDMSKEFADLLCDRLSAVGCFEEARRLQYLRALGPEEGTPGCPWFGERLPRLREALTAYVRGHLAEFAGEDGA